jgi:hypothetical protein
VFNGKIPECKIAARNIEVVELEEIIPFINGLNPDLDKEAIFQINKILPRDLNINFRK